MQKIIPVSATLIPDNAQKVFSGVIFDIYQWQQQLFNGDFATFEMLRRSDSVRIIAIVDNHIVVVKDEQPNRQPVIAFPGGRVDADDDSPLHAAMRELREETGYEFLNWRMVNVEQPESKNEHFVYTFLAWSLEWQGSVMEDSGERISVMHKTYEEVRDMATDNIGYIGRAKSLFEHTSSLDELMQLTPFKGKEITR